MTKLLHFFIVFACQITLCWGQSYISAVGLRLGGSGIAISAQQRLVEKISVEAIVRSNLHFKQLNKASVTGLLEYHYYLMGRAINGYVGLGGHRNWEKDSLSFYGFDGIIGLEGTLFNLNTSLDYKPIYNIVAGTPRFGNQFALSVRYVIVYAHFGKKSKKPFDENELLEKETWL